MDRMIEVNDNTINRQVGNVQNKGVVFRWETHKFRSVDISGRRNQCLQFCLNAFYHDVNDLKKQQFSGQLPIEVNVKYVVRMTMRSYSIVC